MTNATTDLRALEVFDHVPPGCHLFLMRDDRHAPHLRAGEFAVVDPTDRELINGELYLIRWSNRSQAVMQVLRRDHCGVDGVWFAPLNRPHPPENAAAWLRSGRKVYCADGPLKPEYLPDYLQGRVIGIFMAPEAAAPAPGLRPLEEG